MIWTRANFSERVWLGRNGDGAVVAAVRPYGRSFRWNMIGGPRFYIVESLDDALAEADAASREGGGEGAR